MPEYPDIEVYIECLEQRILKRPLIQCHLVSPFLLRTVSPSPSTIEGHQVTALRRIGKRIALGFSNDHWMVLHLMIGGRLQWSENSPGRSRNLLGYWEFDSGILSLTEAGSKKRASLHLVPTTGELDDFDGGGLEIMDACLTSFVAALTGENRTLKRALTDPRIFSGIGNAYSDEILFRARLSPVTLTRRIDETEQRRLFAACQEVLEEWHDRLRREVGNGFPEKVTAFRSEMAVHGKFGKACQECGELIQRIRYATNETNYCPRCQTGGKLLADRSLSTLLRKDWPKTVEELEALRKR